MVDWLQEHHCGQKKVSYKLRDWLFSRQRYWGEPIPIVHMEDGTMRTVPVEELPLELPATKNFQPHDSGESPLANSEDWLEVEIDGQKDVVKQIQCLNGLGHVGIIFVILIHIIVNKFVIQNY